MTLFNREIDENPKEETDSQDEEVLPVKIPSAPVEHIPAVVGPPRSPLPPDSPLLRSRTASPALQRARWGMTRISTSALITDISVGTSTRS